jgi:hypothetical protein
MAASTTLTPAERILRARMAGYACAAQGKTNTAPASRGFRLRFEREVDPNHELPEEERAKRTEAALKSYMAGLALKKSQAARKGKGKTDGGSRAESRGG